MPETAEPKHWTYGDYLRIPDDGKRYEIIRGDKLVCPSPNKKHQNSVLALGASLRSFSLDKHVGWCGVAPFDVVLAKDVVLQPDVFFVARERLDIAGEGAVTAAPDLVVEVLSDSTRTRDYMAKRRLYAEHGVREYWIVDPELERVEQFVLEGGDLAHKRVVSSGEVTSLAVLPGFAVKIADLFA